MNSIWERLAEVWGSVSSGLSAPDAAATREALLFVLVPLAGDEEVPREVAVAVGRMLARAGVQPGEREPLTKLAAWFRVHPLSAEAKRAVEALLEALPKDVSGAANRPALAALGLSFSVMPVGTQPPPAGSVRGPMGVMIERAKQDEAAARTRKGGRPKKA